MNQHYRVTDADGNLREEGDAERIAIQGPWFLFFDAEGSVCFAVSDHGTMVMRGYAKEEEKS